MWRLSFFPLWLTQSIILFIGSFCFGLVYFTRYLPSYFKEDLTTQYGVTDTEIATSGAIYFWCYAVTQIIGGFLADLIPSNLLMFGSCLVGASGVLISGLTNNYSFAVFGRMLHGIGFGPLYVPANGLLARWFSDKNFPLASGILTASGNIGGLLAQLPLASIDPTMHQAYIFGACITIAFGVLCLIFMIESPEKAGYPIRKLTDCGDQEEEPITESPEIKSKRTMKDYLWQLVHNLWFVLKNPQFYLINMYNGFNCSTMQNLTSLYGQPYLLNSVLPSTETTVAVLMMTLMSAAWIVGSPVNASLTNLLKSRKAVCIAAGLGALTISLVFFFVVKDGTAVPILGVLFFLYSWFTGATIGIPTVMNKEAFRESAATAMGLGNFCPFFMTGILQLISPYTLEAATDNSIVDVRERNLKMYRYGIWIVNAAFHVVGIISAILMKDTYPKEEKLVEKREEAPEDEVAPVEL